MTRYTSSQSFNAWAAKRRADPDLPADAARAAAPVEPRTVSRKVPEPLAEQVRKDSNRGRPALSAPNTIREYMPILADLRVADTDGPIPYPWFTDIVAGSIATAAGSSQGTFNVSPSRVIAALFMPVIAAKLLTRAGTNERTAQRITKAARHAANGIASYLERNSEVRAKLDHQLTIERLSWIAPGLVHEAVPESILDLKRNGDLMDYAEALRDFRLETTRPATKEEDQKWQALALAAYARWSSKDL